MNEVTALVRLVRALAHDPAGIAMLAPQLCVDPILGVERRHDDVGDLGVAFGVADFFAVVFGVVFGVEALVRAVSAPTKDS